MAKLILTIAALGIAGILTSTGASAGGYGESGYFLKPQFPTYTVTPYPYGGWIMRPQ